MKHYNFVLQILFCNIIKGHFTNQKYKIVRFSLLRIPFYDRPCLPFGSRSRVPDVDRVGYLNISISSCSSK